MSSPRLSKRTVIGGITRAMNEIEIAIICFAMGYFWAMWRVENIRIHGFKVFNTIDAKEFWEQAEEWKARQEQAKP